MVERRKKRISLTMDDRSTWGGGRMDRGGWDMPSYLASMSWDDKCLSRMMAMKVCS